MKKQSVHDEQYMSIFSALPTPRCALQRDHEQALIKTVFSLFKLSRVAPGEHVPLKVSARDSCTNFTSAIASNSKTRHAALVHRRIDLIN